MRKTIAFLVASAVIVGTAYYWWIGPIGVVLIVLWSMFPLSARKSRNEEKETPLIEIEDYIR